MQRYRTLMWLGALAVLLMLVAIGTSEHRAASATSETITVDIPPICCGTPGTQSSPQLAFSTNVTTQGTLVLEYLVPSGHCSSVRLHISLDGVPVSVTEFLGYPGDPLGRPMTTGPIDLGPASAGTHTITLLPEGTVGGCNDGTLNRWRGTLIVTVESSGPVIEFSNLQPADGAQVKQEADAVAFLGARGWMRRLFEHGGAETEDTGWLQKKLLKFGVHPVIHGADLDSTGEIDWSSVRIYLNGEDKTESALVCRFGASAGSVQLAHYWFDNDVTVRVVAATTDGTEAEREWTFSVETAVIYPTWGWGALKWWLDRWWIPVTSFLSLLYDPEPLGSC